MTMMSTNNDDEGEGPSSSHGEEQHEQKAAEIVRELCHRTSEANKELQKMEHRLGKYQKFAWNTTDRGGGGGGGSRKKKRKRGSTDTAPIHIEWQNEDQLCSLVYTPKKKKSSHAKSNSSCVSFDS